MKKILVTGSSGLIGSEVCKYFTNKNFKIFGIDNKLVVCKPDEALNCFLRTRMDVLVMGD